MAHSNAELDVKTFKDLDMSYVSRRQNAGLKPGIKQRTSED